MTLLRPDLAEKFINAFGGKLHQSSMKINTGRIICLYGASLLIICVFFISCGSKKLEPTKTGLISSDSIPTQESFKTSVTFSDSGNVKAVLKAGRIRQYARFNYTLVDSGATVDFYNYGVYSSTLTRKRGK